MKFCYWHGWFTCEILEDVISRSYESALLVLVNLSRRSLIDVSRMDSIFLRRIFIHDARSLNQALCFIVHI